MLSKDIFGGLTREMEGAFQNILYEIIEHAIEGICFEAHRAIKLGYFTEKEYMLKERQFEIYKELSETNGDIYGNKHEKVFTMCKICNQEKDAKILSRHMLKCRARTKNNSNLDNSGKAENCKNNVEGNNGDGKKGNHVERQVKSVPKYETMSPEQIQLFLLKQCGVISRRNGIPCRNSLNCNIHVKEDRDKVRSFFFESFPEHLTDGNIDIDTVD